MISEGLHGLHGSSQDICVIGAGPVGISLALEMERLGRSVIFWSPAARKSRRKGSSWPRRKSLFRNSTFLWISPSSAASVELRTYGEVDACRWIRSTFPVGQI